MELMYPFFVAFSMIFFAELGDKTQLLVLSFSTKNSMYKILLGVALGTFFSHGLAILFGSRLASFSQASFQFYLKLFTYFSFIVFGAVGFFPENDNSSSSNKLSFLDKFKFLHLGAVTIVAISIVIGELGDKTFLASLGLGLEYPMQKISLICGSIFGMVLSNLLAIFCGKFLSHYLKPSMISFLSNVIFLAFGILGLAGLFIDFVNGC